MVDRTEALLKSLEAQATASLSAADDSEVAQVFELVFNLLSQMKTEYDSADEANKADIAARAADLRKAINELATDTGTSIKDIRKTLGILVKWREGQDARTTDNDLGDAVERIDGIDSEIQGIQATIKTWKLKHGEDGDMGPMPDHEWDGTKLRFERPDGTWGEWVDLKGEHSGGGFTMFGGAGMGGVRTIRAGSSNVHVGSGDGDVVITVDTPVAALTHLITEQLVGVQSGNDVLLDFSGLTHVPNSILFVSRQGQIQVPASSAPADGSSAVNINGTTNARVYNADAASEIFLIGYGY